MPDLRLIRESEGTGDLAAEYDAARARSGRVSNIVPDWSAELSAVRSLL